MLLNNPRADREQFHELGDGCVRMPLNMMERYLYPKLRVMQHLHRNAGQYDYVPGGVESMLVYSFFHQGAVVSKNHTVHDLNVLRNSVFPAGADLSEPLRTNADVTEGISTHLRTTLRRIKEFAALPSFDKLEDMTPELLDERQLEINALFGMYEPLPAFGCPYCLPNTKLSSPAWKINLI